MLRFLLAFLVCFTALNAQSLVIDVRVASDTNIDEILFDLTGQPNRGVGQILVHDQAQPNHVFTVDGIALAVGDLFLATNQDDASNNGIWVVGGAINFFNLHESIRFAGLDQEIADDIYNIQINVLQGSLSGSTFQVDEAGSVITGFQIGQVGTILAFEEIGSSTNPMPEPETAVLLGTGLLLLSGFGKKKQKTSNHERS